MFCILAQHIYHRRMPAAFLFISPPSPALFMFHDSLSRPRHAHSTPAVFILHLSFQHQNIYFHFSSPPICLCFFSFLLSFSVIRYFLFRHRCSFFFLFTFFERNIYSHRVTSPTYTTALDLFMSSFSIFRQRCHRHARGSSLRSSSLFLMSLLPSHYSPATTATYSFFISFFFDISAFRHSSAFRHHATAQPQPFPFADTLPLSLEF